MINQDLLTAAKTLLENMKALRAEGDALNLAFMAAMDQDDKVAAVRALFPMILKAANSSAEIISDAFLAVDWEKEGSTPEVFYNIMAGQGVIPEELREDVDDLLESLNGTEKDMVDRFGPEPMMAAIRSLGLEEELSDLINAKDEVQALLAALQDTPGVPLVTQE